MIVDYGKKVRIRMAEIIYIDSRFTEIKEDIICQLHLISKDIIHNIEEVAEGVDNLGKKVDIFFDDLIKEIEESRQEILATINSLMLNSTGGLQSSRLKWKT